jgi:hypothetical protein
VHYISKAQHGTPRPEDPRYRRKWLRRYVRRTSCCSHSHLIHFLRINLIYGEPGSAVCKAALARGFQVTSIRFVPSHLFNSDERTARAHPPSTRTAARRAGRTRRRRATPPRGHPKCRPFPSSALRAACDAHAPLCFAQVDWRRGDARDPGSFAPLLRDATAVVHTLGTLLEDTRYKAALRTGELGGLLRAAAGRVGDVFGGGRNPLAGAQPGGYDEMNRDLGASACCAASWTCGY